MRDKDCSEYSGDCTADGEFVLATVTSIDLSIVLTILSCYVFFFLFEPQIANLNFINQIPPLGTARRASSKSALVINVETKTKGIFFALMTRAKEMMTAYALRICIRAAIA